MLDISIISNILSRPLGNIITRLYKNKIILNRISSFNGYMNYKNSNYYKTIILKYKEKKQYQNKISNNYLISINKYQSIYEFQNI